MSLDNGRSVQSPDSASDLASLGFLGELEARKYFVLTDAGKPVFSKFVDGRRFVFPSCFPCNDVS